MARKRLLRSVLAGQTAALALAVACGAMLPLGVDRDGQGMWSLHLNVALADICVTWLVSAAAGGRAACRVAILAAMYVSRKLTTFGFHAG